MTSRIQSATTIQDYIDIIESPDCSEWLLENLPAIMANTERKAPLSVDVPLIKAVLASPHFSQKAAEVWRGVTWYVERTAVSMFESDMPLSPNGLLLAVGDRYGGRDASFRVKVLRSSQVTEEIVSLISEDYRLTSIREAAKHPLLTFEKGIKFVTHEDAKCRANVIRQAWLPDESLYLLRDDSDSAVSRAAKKALKARGLSETDEIDAVMDDEVSLFFLSASEDEDMLVRIGSNPLSPASALQTVAELGGRGAFAVAANPNAPSDLLESMSLTDAESKVWRSKIRPVLAGNPNNTVKGLLALVECSRWDADTMAKALMHPLTPEDVVNENSTNYGSKTRIAAIKSGKINQENLDTILVHDTRTNVLSAILDYCPKMLSNTQVLHCHRRSGATRVRNKALALLNSRGFSLTSDVDSIE